jgi:tetratricopeptide (TPR) repeat protein
VQQEIIAPQKEECSKNTNGEKFVLLGILLIVAVVFSGSLKLQWTNWDDHLLVYENPLVQHPHLKDIFIKPADYNTYNPLVLITFALEWMLVGDRPFLYHFHNVLLHLLCTTLVWLVFRRLGLSAWWSGLAALFFGIHPLRVESVAWISERKDVLFGFFYLAAILAYIRYIHSRKNIYLWGTGMLFLLALLSKGQAVALPFTLIVLDWYFKRKLDWKVIAEKIVFFALALIIGLLGTTYFFKNIYTSTDDRAIVNSFNGLGYLVLAGYSYTVYLVKIFFPLHLSPLYPIPWALTFQHVLGAAIALTVLLSSIFLRQRHRDWAFGIWFFTFNIFLMLMPFLASDTAFLHDRYAYMAHVGIFFIIGMSAQKLADRYFSLRIPLLCCALGTLLICGLLTVKYIPVWENSETLWTHVINRYPRQIALAYINRGCNRYVKGEDQKAIEDFNAAIAIHPKSILAYRNRAFVYWQNNRLSEALRDYHVYLSLIGFRDENHWIADSRLAEGLNNRGLVYFKLGQYTEALRDFNVALKINPKNVQTYLNRAYVYMAMHRYDKALDDLNTYQQYDSSHPDVANNRGVCLLRMGILPSALDAFNQAIFLRNNNPAYYRNRAEVYKKLGYQEKAQADWQTAANWESAINRENH